MSNSTMIDAHGRSAEMRAQIKAQKEAINKAAAENWDNPVWRRQMAAEITETIWEGFDHENLLSILTEVESVGFNDRSFIKETRGLRAFWVARGGYIEESTLRSDVMEITRDTIGIHVSEFEDKLVTNFAETSSTLIEKAIQRMDAEINARFLAALQAAVPSSSDYYLDSAGVDLDAINVALREVRDETRSFEVSIVGRSTMTDQIMDQLIGTGNNGAGFIPESNEQMVRRGVLGQYRGANIVTLRNFKDDEDIAFFPANEMYIVARDASKFAFFGGLLSKEFSEQDNWYWHYLARRDFGGAVHRPERLRRIVDTSLSA